MQALVGHEGHEGQTACKSTQNLREERAVYTQLFCTVLYLSLASILSYYKHASMPTWYTSDH